MNCGRTTDSGQVQIAEQSQASPLALCELLEVSSSGYYAWKKRDESRRQQEDKQLSTAIEEVFRASRETYGSNRVRFALRQNGIYTSRKRVARLMRQRGLRSVRNKRV